MKMHEAIIEYINSPEWARLSKSSRETYTYAIDYIPNLEVESVTRPIILAIRNNLMDKPAMADMVVTVLRNILELQYDKGVIPYNHAYGVKKINKSTPIPAWSMEEIEAFMESEKPWNTDRLFHLALFTGQRRSDLVKPLMIHKNMLSIVQQKTGTEVFIPVHKRLKPFVERGWSGPAPSPREASRWIAVQCQQLGLDGRTIHGLRKSCATFLAEVGCTTHEIMAITGHRSLSEVERYTRPARQALLAASAMTKYEGEWS